MIARWFTICLVTFAVMKPASGNDRSLRVTGRVVDADTGMAIDRFRLVVGSPYDHIHTSWQYHLQQEHTGGEYTWQVDRAWQKTRLRIEADDYQPGVSPILQRRNGAGVLNVDFKLRSDPGIVGIVIDSQRRPVAGAQVAINTHSLQLHVRGEKLIYGQQKKLRGRSVVTTDAGGRFKIPSESDPFQIVASHDEHGFAVMPQSELNRKTLVELQLEPWCRIEADCTRADGQPDRDAMYSLMVGWQKNEAWPNLWLVNSKSTDDDGRYVWTHVAPGWHYLQRWIGNQAQRSWSVHALAGQTIRFSVSQQTRTVLGKVVADEGRLTEGFDFSQWVMNIRPAEGRQIRIEPPVFFANSKRVRHEIMLGDNGEFKIDDLPPGKYDAFVQHSDGSRFHINQKLNVPLTSEDDERPFDCGELTMLTGKPDD